MKTDPQIYVRAKGAVPGHATSPIGPCQTTVTVAVGDNVIVGWTGTGTGAPVIVGILT